MAQFGRALRSGRRGRRFKSCHLDQKSPFKRTEIFLSKPTGLVYHQHPKGVVYHHCVSSAYHHAFGVHKNCRLDDIQGLRLDLFYALLYNIKNFLGIIMAFGLGPSTFSGASGQQLQYAVMQVTLKEKGFGTGSKNLADLEKL